MTILVLGAIACIVILAGVGVMIYYASPHQGISEDQKSFYYNKLRETRDYSPSERIYEYDKILSFILRDYGFEGSVGEQLKAKPVILSGYLDEVWRLHKIRNNLAHEMDHGYKNGQLKKEADAFEKILLRILEK